MSDPSTFADDIAGTLAGIYGDAAKDASGGALDFDYLDANAAKYAKERGAEMIGTNANAWSVDQTTRDEVNKLLQQAIDEGWSPQKFAARLEESGLFSAERAEIIARTEVAIAQNYGQSETYAEMGFDRMYVYDGDCDICREVDGEVCSIAWAQEHPVGHPNAIFEGTEVLTLGSVTTGYRAKWSGPAVRIATAMGHELAVSANHPVLTGRGWIAAKDVRHGDNVISNLRRDDGACAGDLYLKKSPAAIEKVFDALATNGAATLCPTSPTHFHGDGNFCQGYVDVVWTDSPLSSEWNAPFLKDGCELIFTSTCAELEPLPSDGASDLGREDIPLSTSRGVSLRDVRRIRIARAQDYPALLQPTTDNQIADADFVRELERRFAVNVALDKVVEVGDVEPFVSHAFDLTTGFGAYFANGILAHNCVRSFSPATSDEPITLSL